MHYFSGKGCFEFLESMHYCIGILNKEREEIIAWANEQACLETLKYKSEKDGTTVMIISPSNRLMDYHKQTLFSDDIFFSNPFIMDLRWILSAEKSTATNL